MEQKPTPAACRQAAVAVLHPAFLEKVDGAIGAIKEWTDVLALGPTDVEEVNYRLMRRAIADVLEASDTYRSAVRFAGLLTN